MSQEKKKYWLSLEEWRKEKPFQELAKKEFISPPFAPEDGQWDRREFLKLMGASLALTSFGCLRRPAETIVPYAHRPEDITLGKSNYYASSYFDEGEGLGLVVQTREGRPIKTEGNPKHPMNQGGMSVRAHSHLLSLYDPERLKTPKRNLFNKKKTNKETIQAYLDEADPLITEQLQKNRTALLTDYFPSPASLELVRSFSKTYPTEHFAWDSYGYEWLAHTYKECFGESVIPSYRLDKAQMIVSIQCDFLGTFLSPVEHTKKFSISRKPTKNMSRLVVFESLLSLTGTNADDRYRIKPSEGTGVVLTLLDEVLKLTRSYPAIQKHLASQRKKLSPLKEETKIRQVAKQLVRYSSKSLVLAGGIEGQTSDSRSLLILTHFLNHVLKNAGSTVDYKNHYTAWSQKHSPVSSLIQKLNKGQIKNLIIHRTNPLYSYPDKEKLTQAIRKAQLVIYTGDRMDETAQVSDYIIPDHHDLEKWGEWEFQKGLHTIQQPTIRPLIQSRTFEDSLITWIRYQNKNAFQQTPSWYEYLKYSVQKRGISWDVLLEKGFQKKNVNFKKSFKTQLIKKIKLKREKKPQLELALYTTPGLKNGHLANVSWLQEFPDPVTKICWDNYLCISPQLAEIKKVKEGQMVEVVSNQKTLSIPVHIQPGQSDEVIGMALGYGRSQAGELANHVGVNASSFMKISKKNTITSGLEVKMQKTNRHIPLAVVQGHHSMEGRQIVVETTLQQYLKNPTDGIHKHKVVSLWSEHKYPREKWAMVIDLNSCTGCGACVVACQSENNIPVVGKKYVLEGREMHWMRVDRYYQGSPDHPESVVHQPVVCMHCDNAPCETVCPVAATVHSDEGTNDMIYNRCVGTRYCSNNCPYKVRRFNWFHYAKDIKTKAALNPDVTVRSRGVMEKCTFCIHRVRNKQAEARLTNTSLKDGDIQTACQQSCPANAIVFGNYNDKNSKVRKAFEEANAYSLLEELNTKPSVRYRTKVRNTTSSISSSHKKGHH